MTPKKPPFTQSELKDMMSYNPDTGILTRILPSGRARDISSTANTDYIQVRILKQCWMAHQLAWYLVHGEWPTCYIDHINGNKKDNRIANLRHVTQAINIQNQNRPGRRNTSGYLGVTYLKDKKKWRAGIFENGTFHHLGAYATAEEAAAVYAAAKPIYHPDAYLESPPAISDIA